MTTVKNKLKKMLISRGMSDEQAEEILKEAIPALQKEAESLSYEITFDSPAEDYPSTLYSIWFATICPIALKWIDDNKPQAWFRDMFL